jgi:hypothetical protein
MSTLNFQPRVAVFDANIGVGHRHDRPAPFEDASQLLEEMALHGVKRALIYHVQGELISAVDGNQQLQTWADGHDALRLQWVAGANQDSLKQVQALHADGRVNSVRLESTDGSHTPFVDWLYGDLLSWLAAERIPLWISMAETPATEIMDTLRKFPQLVCVLVGAHYSHSGFVSPLLKHLPNAYLELSRYENLDGINKLIGVYGTQRFLYGSYYPRYAMGSILFYLHHMGLDDDTLAALCAGNLERLLAGKELGDEA